MGGILKTYWQYCQFIWQIDYMSPKAAGDKYCIFGWVWGIVEN